MIILHCNVHILCEVKIVNLYGKDRNLICQFRTFLFCCKTFWSEFVKHVLYFPGLFSADGKIDFEEFIDLVESLRNQTLEEASFLEAFRAFDVNGRGYVKSKDVRDTLMQVMVKCPEDEKRKILRLFNLDVDRNVQFDGMLNVFFNPISTRRGGGGGGGGFNISSRSLYY